MTLDEIFQTGVPVPKAGLKEWLETINASQDAEAGVLYPGYAIGDVRRYGVFPDGVTNWEDDYGDQMAAIYANSCLPGICIYWPPGDYATGINLTTEYSGSRMHFDNAVFYSILHWIDVSDVVWTGEISTYDRFGIAYDGVGSSNLKLGICHLLNDPTKNLAGYGGRGVHLATASNFDFELFDVVDCAECNATPPGNTGNLAAVWIESQGLSGIRGRIHVQNSQTNGVFINALDVDLDIQVDGYGNQAITGSGQLQGLTVTQTQIGFGVCIQRSTGQASIVIDQSNASPAADVYTLFFPETGVSTVASSRHKAFNVTSLRATVGDANRGICIGSAEDKLTTANVVFSGVSHIRRRGTDSLASGYAGLNVLSPPAVASNYRRFVSTGALTFDNFEAVLEFQAQAVATSALDNYTEVIVAQMNFPVSSSGSISLVGNASTGGVLKGSISNISLYWSAGSNATPSILLDGCTDFDIRGGELRLALQGNTTAVSMTNNINCSVTLGRVVNYGSSSNGAIAINAGNSRCRIGPISLERPGAITTSIGVRFTGTQTDCTFHGLVMDTAFSSGFKKGTSPVFTRCAAIACTATGNTANTDLATSDFAAANQLACTNFAV